LRPLAELQHHFIQALMSGDVPAMLFAGRVPAGDALAVHRGTILAALVNALRVSYPTVDALVGQELFDQACTIFAKINLPRTACLAAYGGDFPDFLAQFPPAASLGYLADVARLDRAVETALHAPVLRWRFALSATVSIELPQNLCILRLAYPADEIRASLGNDSAMAGIIPLPAERFILVWRKGFDAAVRRVSPAAGRFLASLLADGSADNAFRAAVADQPRAEAMQSIQADIFAASFCSVISNSGDTTS
jgi:hypothetical protein